MSRANSYKECLRSARGSISLRFADRMQERLSLQFRPSLRLIQPKGVGWRGVRLFVPQNNYGCITQ
jgi:hypothetical protein